MCAASLLSRERDRLDPLALTSAFVAKHKPAPAPSECSIVAGAIARREGREK
jgi:hypothetical protein